MSIGRVPTSQRCSRPLRPCPCFDTAIKEIKLPKYEKWGAYEQFLPGNIERFCEYWGRGY